jgi:hypothetical protein
MPENSPPVDVGRIFQHLDGNGALSCGDHRIIERMHKGQPLALFEFAGVRIGIIIFLAEQDDLAAIGLGLLHLDGRRRLGHDDGDRHAKPRAVPRQPLGMIARRRCDDSLGLGVVAHLAEEIERAAFLVSRSELEIFELQIDRCPGDRRQGATDKRGGADDRSGDADMRGADIVKGEQVGRAGHVGCGP